MIFPKAAARPLLSGMEIPPTEIDPFLPLAGVGYREIEIG
jgi:hypothetical protein